MILASLGTIVTGDNEAPPGITVKGMSLTVGASRIPNIMVPYSTYNYLIMHLQSTSK